MRQARLALRNGVAADAVFVGHVVSISSAGGRRVELAVTEPFRGLQLSQVTVVTDPETYR